MKKTIFISAMSAGLLISNLAQAEFESRLETDMSIQARLFPQTAVLPAQRDANLSLALEPEWYAEWDRGAYSVTFTPFARVEMFDSERSHFDIRELYWQGVYDRLEIRAGISSVFWGRTEFLHLIDVINQKDALENPDLEDKLGQPMLRANYATGAGNLQAYVLPYFREREFSGPEGRLRPPLPISNDATYESSEEEKHVDFALRFAGWVGALDYGIAWFSGTQREAQLLPDGFVNTANGPVPTRVTAFYPQMDQVSLDAQYTSGSWLWKLEAYWRDTAATQLTPQGPRAANVRYGAATGGFEYSFYGVMESSADLGLIVEYAWDERGRGPSSFQNDVFIGSRLAMNDVNDSSLLVGAGIDMDQSDIFGSVEAARRLTESSKLAIEARIFNRIDPQDLAFYAARRDDYLQLEYSYFF